MTWNMKEKLWISWFNFLLWNIGKRHIMFWAEILVIFHQYFLQRNWRKISTIFLMFTCRTCNPTVIDSWLHHVSVSASDLQFQYICTLLDYRLLSIHHHVYSLCISSNQYYSSISDLFVLVLGAILGTLPHHSNGLKLVTI